MSPQELFEKQAEKSREATAVVFGDRGLSYNELNARANRLAHSLRDRSEKPGQLVAVCLDRSAEMIVAFLAVLKSGGVYLPLDPRFPPSRLEYILSDAKPSLVLTQKSKEHSLPGTSATSVFVDDDSCFTSFSSSNLQSRRKASELAYVIYTSGSTGRPKGVMVPERALSNFLHSMTEKPGITASDVLLATTTCSFDISILEMLLPLVTGARVVIAMSEQAMDPAELNRLLVENGVTVMQATPTMWRTLVESGWKGKSDLKILCGGEPLTADLAEQLLPLCAELWNMYGPTETTIWSATERITSADRISIGAAIANTRLYVVDEQIRCVAPGASGELLIGGDGLADGYLNQPELTRKQFIADPFSDNADARLYRTGDEVRLREDGRIEFIGRLDDQVKVRGFRIELSEIEASLSRIEGIQRAIVVLREFGPNEKQVVAYYTGRDGFCVDDLAQRLKQVLPEYMVPGSYMHIDNFPLTANGKIDRKALPLPANSRRNLAQDYVGPATAAETQLVELWKEILQIDQIGVDDNFFDLGGTSVTAARMVALYQARYGRKISVLKVFEHPTVSQFAREIEQEEKELTHAASNNGNQMQQRAFAKTDDTTHAGRVAIIGMVGRFPGADNLTELWRNLINSVESISFFSPEELGPGIDDRLRADPDYIRARGVLRGAELFDAAYFGINPLEARIMDPQQRVFLELAQHALENAGYDPSRYKGRIGVFAGAGDNHYYSTNLLTRPGLLATAGKLAVEYGNEKDYLALRIAYLLDLRGPAISLNTACSTSLVTVDVAFNSLLNSECDMALAGGIDISVPQKSGFLYQEGGTFAKDGHCRPFDADATGTMFCDGAGIVVLKRLADALADGDRIYAVLCGSAKNNNGARPASFLAPSVEGQADVISMAQERAGIPVETIRYIEAHGTGTPVGDPIEFEALCKAFRARTDRRQFCYVGSIKGNIGHPTNAAGVAGLIKTALVLDEEEIPPTHHYKKPNPKMHLDDSPFRIADRRIPLSRNGEPRRAAVSSFGFGGTNVHMILEEAPPAETASSSRALQLLLLSARTPSALAAYSRNLGEHLATYDDGSFADTAYTLQVGRKQMAERKFVVAADRGEAATLLSQPNPLRCGAKRCERRDPSIVFLFGGQGTQYINMGLNLYRGEEVFHRAVDECCDILKPRLNRDLREVLYPKPEDEEATRATLRDTYFTQPAIFTIEYALAQLWRSWGVRPGVMLGHSIGEFVAATLARVWSLEDALRIVAMRGRLMQGLPRGSMLAVGAPTANVEPMLPESIQVASVNAPGLCVISGPTDDIAAVQHALESKGFVCRQLHTSHAFHSAMMDPIVEPLRAEVAKAQLRAPKEPIISTVTGQPLTEAETTNPRYWARHARETVQFAKAVQYAIAQGSDLFLECGPRATLCSLVRQQGPASRSCQAIPSGADTPEGDAEYTAILFALGSLWQNGVSINWEGFYGEEKRRRVPLPCYPFERQRFWVDPAPRASAAATIAVQASAGLEERGAEQPGDGASANARAGAKTATRSRAERLQDRLAEVIAPLSGRESSEISRSATLVEQGFDSISLVQVAFAIRNEFGVKVSFSQLMHEYPNLEMIAAHLEQAAPASEAAAVVQRDITPSPAPAVAPVLPAVTNSASGQQPESTTGAAVEAVNLDDGRATSLQRSNGTSPATSGTETRSARATLPQRGIFSSSQLSDELNASYNESVTMRFKGNISVPKLTRAIERLVARHDALRASFDSAGELMQVAPSVAVEVGVTDLSTYSNGEMDGRLDNIVTEEMGKAFPLPSGPLFRAHIVQLAADSAAVIMTAHHVICDGWSVDILIHDLCAFYSEELSGKAVALQRGESYIEYVRNVNERLGSSEYREAREYWHRMFRRGFPVLVLPTDGVRVSKRSFGAERLVHVIPQAVVTAMKAFAAAQGCSFFSIVLSGLALLLARVSQQDQFVLALPVADQPTIGQLGLVGHCVSLLPFLVGLREKETAGRFVQRVQEQLGEMHDHTAFNWLDLMRDLRRATPAQGISASPAGLTHTRKFEAHELPQSGFSVSYEPNPKRFDSFEFYVNAVEGSGGLTLIAHYASALFDRATVAAWLDGMTAILAGMTADAERNAKDIVEQRRARRKSPPQVQYVLRSNGTGRDFATIHVDRDRSKAVPAPVAADD
ncbi:MAG TPA: amino acid adenylation domain-containing protein [Candidatus Acidoferrales bacterium]|nr:amino acid adenylation domain-containing protein [Candidatus Acidoferrales bacterium]